MKKFRFSVLLATLLGAAVAMAGDKSSSTVTFLVLKEFNGKPIRNASVVLHPVNKSGKQERSGQQLKTDSEGRTVYDGIPYGKVRVQVIAPNLQTYGEDFDINQPEQEIVIKLKRPQEQHSIYK